jgi:hypothetical protein
MDSTWSAIKATRKTGSEPFHNENLELGFTVQDFWQWAVSDLVSNANRGLVAEYIVARALGLGDVGVRNEWDSWDLLTASNIKVEVKSAAFVQTWFQKGPSPIRISVPARRGWDASTNIIDPELIRRAEVYVFAILSHNEKSSIDPLNLSQWTFYVLPTSTLNSRHEKSLNFNTLMELCPEPVPYSSLRDAVERAAKPASKS